MLHRLLARLAFALLLLAGSLLAGPAAPSVASAQAALQEVVRVRLFAGQRLTEAQLFAHDGAVAFRLAAGGGALGRLASTGTASIALRGSEVGVETPDGGFFAPIVRAEPDQPPGQWTLVVDGERRTYSGALVATAQDGELVLINEAPVEDYVAGVVASEYGLGDGAGAKAMAVVARTYGLKAAQKFDGDYDHADGTLSQVYQGLKSITPGARRAAEATRGEVLTYDGELIEAVYFSSSGGHTANNEDVWDASEALPYLRGKRDPYDRTSPYREWTVSLDRTAVLLALERRFGGPVRGFVIDERSSDGRVRTIELLRSGNRREAVQANAFRLAVSSAPGAALKSTWFTARRSGSRYVFTGRGFGHGVGLGQYGAYGMAQRGADYREILDFYYTGARLTTLDTDRPLAAQVTVTRDTTRQTRQEAFTPPRVRRRIGW